MGEQIEEETYTGHFRGAGSRDEKLYIRSSHHIISNHALYMRDTTYRPYQSTVHRRRGRMRYHRLSKIRGTIHKKALLRLYHYTSLHFLYMALRCHYYIIDHHACLRHLNTIDNLSLNYEKRTREKELSGNGGFYLETIWKNGRQMLGEENLISWVVLARLRTHLRFAWTHYCFAGRSSYSLGVGMVKAGTFLLCEADTLLFLRLFSLMRGG